MPENKICSASEEANEPEVPDFNIKPLSRYDLSVEKNSNNYEIDLLCDEYDKLYRDFQENHSEDLAIRLINLRKEITCLAANAKELEDAQNGIIHERKREIIN